MKQGAAQEGKRPAIIDHFTESDLIAKKRERILTSLESSRQKSKQKPSRVEHAPLILSSGAFDVPLKADEKAKLDVNVLFCKDPMISVIVRGGESLDFSRYNLHRISANIFTGSVSPGTVVELARDINVSRIEWSSPA